MKDNKVDFVDLVRSITIIQKYNSMELQEIAKEWSEWSGQVITDEMVDEFRFIGLNNVDFLTSDFLNKYGGIKSVSIFKNEMKAKRQDLLDCMLSIYDTLKLHDNGSLLEDDETLSEIMFRKMKAYNIDLNKELGFTHLKPVTKRKNG